MSSLASPTATTVARPIPAAQVAARSRDAVLRLPLIGALLVAFALGCLRLGAQSLWYDEGVTAMVAQKPLAELVAWTAADIQPPLSYLLVSAGGALWGWSEWALRFPSVLAATLAVAFLARLAAALRVPTAAPPGHSAPDWTPAWAALLLALHPLLLYYAQEARMYTLLLALCTAAAVALAPALQARMGLRRWLAYALLATLALYTHYFALFVLLAFALAWFWPADRQQGAPDPRAGWRGFLLAHGLIALLYAPWAVIMLRQWGSDSSYWQGRLKWGEALAETAARFVAGETMPERPAMFLALAVLALTTVGVLLLWRRATARRVALRFALIWLLVPVAGVLLLASFAPKFNVRYVFPALPGLVLLWALLADAATQATNGRAARLKRAGAWMAVVALLGVFVWSTVNWHTDLRYAKAQWRELTTFLRARLAPDERIVLVSGHAWPVWAYYAPDLPVIRLPNLDVLDVNQILDFGDTAGALRAAIPDGGGAWLVEWQGEVVDPNGVVPVQLELGGREKGSSARFSQLTLRRWGSIRPARFADGAPITVPVYADFGGGATLLGYHALDNGDLLFFWQAGQHLDGRDLYVWLDTQTAAGETIASTGWQRLGGYTYPTMRWQPDEFVMGRFAATDWLGEAPVPGPYTVTVRVLSDEGHPHLNYSLHVNGKSELQLEGVTAVIE